MSPHLLVVDDEPNIVELLSASLRFAGFEVHHRDQRRRGAAQAREVEPDLVVLDVMMPGLDGFEVVRRLREEGRRVPVLFLTARDAVEDRIIGLHPRRRRLRHQAVQPGGGGRPGPGAAAPGRSREQPTAEAAARRYADLELDEDSHEVARAASRSSCRRPSSSCCATCWRTPGRVLSKAQILDHVWNYDFGGDAGVVESYISYLRRKVDTGDQKLLHTVRGVGYVLRTPARPQLMQLTHRRFADRYPLRVTIVVVLLTLVALALAASGVVATTIMRGYLVDRVDEQLHQTVMQVQRIPPDRRPQPPGTGELGRRPLPSEFVVQFNDSEGTSDGGPIGARLAETEPLPKLPTLNLNQVRALDGKSFNVDAVSGGATWRVVAIPLDNGSAR